MGRLANFGRCVAGGLLCVAGSARSDEPLASRPAAAAVEAVPADVAPPLPLMPLAPAAAVQPPTDLPAIPVVPGPAVPAPPRRARSADDGPAGRAGGKADPKKSELPPDTTRQPIDRILDPSKPPAPGMADAVDAAAAQASYVYFPTLGFAGPSGVLPAVRRERRVRHRRGPLAASASPSGTATARGTRGCSTTRTSLGRWYDPYHQNVLKGDYPIIGQHTFLNITGINSHAVRGADDPDGDDAVREHRAADRPPTSSAGPGSSCSPT